MPDRHSLVSALHLVATLNALAEINPTFSEILINAAIDIQQRSQARVQEARASVLYAVRKRQCWTVRELMAETGFSEDKVRRLLNDLIATGQLYVVRAPSDAQRGGNRKLRYYLPLDQKWTPARPKKQESKIKS